MFKAELKIICVEFWNFSISIKNYIVTEASIFHGNTSSTSYARRQVILCVTKASVCYHTFNANHRQRLWEILPIIGA